MRISLFAGPGSGKSTTAALQFSNAKIAGHSIELVTEYVKAWAISKRKIVGFDQVYLMSKQLQYEYRFLSNGIKNIITDSPVLLAACYTRAYFPSLANVANHMEGIILEYEREHPSINIFIERDDKTYNNEGRYHNKEDAKLLDTVIKKTLDRLDINYVSIPFNEQTQIEAYINQHIEK